MRMAEKKSQDEAQIIQKKNDKIMKRQAQYEELKQKIVSENIPVDKLSIQQLRILCMQKKRDDDKIAISKMKRSDLTALWIAWQSQPDIVVETVPNNTEIEALPQDADDDMVDDHDNIVMI